MGLRIFRSLHMKLALILVLLIISLMAVVGVFLINGVVDFYLQEFSSQMAAAFNHNAEFTAGLSNAAGSGDDAPIRVKNVLHAYSGRLGINYTERNFYVLDDHTGAYLAGSRDELGQQMDITPNILTALNGEPGYARRVTENYMDIAVPIDGDDGNRLIVYIKDTKAQLNDLTSQLFMIILESVMFGLLISILLSFLLSKTMTTPLENLTRAATMMASGDFSHLIEVHASDELGILTNTFNTMGTALQETLEAVAGERDKLGTLFLHMTDGVLAFNRDGAAIQVNPAARRLLALYGNVGDMRYSDILEEVIPLPEVLALRQPNFAEKEHAVGTRQLKLFLAPFGGQSPSEAGVVVVVHDITEQQRLEDLRREFVSNVSHELRTPLTSIKSYAETIADSGDLDADTVTNFANVIVGETDRMTRIVQDLLVLSRFDYGKMDWKMAPFPLQPVVEKIVEAMRLEAERRQHELRLTFRSELPTLKGDRDRIEQVLVNILSNAIKYTPDGGLIEIEAGFEGGLAWISVRDNGIGIPAEDLPRLFERFYRVDKARSRASGGTGLGLAIAREIIYAHEGDIIINSRHGQGTKVTVTLSAKSGGALLLPEPSEET